MRKVWRTQVVVANLLLALSATGCNGQHQQAKLAQSEEALRGLKDGGVITEQEYNQRLAQLQSTGQAAAEKTSYTPNHTWRMKKVQLKAMTGWPAMPEWNIAAKPEQQIVAFTMLVPVDWQFAGGVNEHKKPDCNFTIGRIGFAALSPDKTAGMVSIPYSVSIWSDDASVLQQVQQDNQKFAKIYNCKIEQPHPLQQQMSSLVQEFSSDSNGKFMPSARWSLCQVRPASCSPPSIASISNWLSRVLNLQSKQVVFPSVMMILRTQGKGTLP